MTFLGAQAEPRPLGSFVGRERELTELRAGLADVRAGHSHLVLLSGEPGIGKSRLADEFGRLAVAQDIRVAWGRCWEGDGAPAYWPWIQVVRACLGDTDGEQRTAILGAEATPQVAQDIAQLLPELRAAYAPASRPPGLQPNDPGQARFQLFESVATLLKNAADIGPLVIVIDDLHDADHPSLLLLKFIAGHSRDARILLVVTYRDTEVRQSQELARLIGDLSREGHSLPILGLSEAEVGEYVARSSGNKADDKLVADLYQATDGNPLFVDGVVRLLVAEGKLDRPGGGDAFKIPDGVQESIRRRLVKLPEETKRMLSIASVIGNQVESQLLARVSGSAAEEIVERMEGALRAGIVIDSSDGAHYRFSHALVREALYQDLTVKRRTQLHAEIAAAIEEVHHDDPKPHLAALAYHFRATGNARKAIDYSIAAADAAEAVFAYEDALSHLRPALAIAESRDHDAARRGAVAFRLGRIIVFFDNHEQGVAYLEHALRLFEQIGDDQHAGEVHSQLGHVFRFFGPQMDIHRALIHLQRAEALLDQRSEQRSLGMLHWGLAMTYLEAMRISDALAASQKAMDIFARLGDQESWARVACHHSGYLMVKGKLAQARALMDKIAEAATSFVNPDDFLDVNIGCGWFWMQMSAPREAMRYYRLALKRPGHDVRQRRDLLSFLTNSETATGNLAGAKRLAEEHYVSPVYRMRIAYYDGDWNAAAKALEEALDSARRAGAAWPELGELNYGVDLCRVTGDYTGAAAALERALRLFQPDDLYWEARMRSQGVMLCFDAGLPEKAAEHVQYCRRVLARGEDWLGRAAALWRAEAIVAAFQDRLEESDRHFEKSIATFRQYSLAWDEAETLHYWGKALLRAGQHQRAVEKLDAAIKIYLDCRGGQSWIDRVEADKRRAESSKSARTEVQSPPTASLSANAPAGTHQQQAAPTGDPTSNERICGYSGTENVFHCEGDIWTITYEGQTLRLRDFKGLRYIALLLQHPGEEFHAASLVSGVDSANGTEHSEARAELSALTAEQLAERHLRPGASEDAGELIDAEAKAAYSRRLEQLREELEEAKEFRDTERIAKAEDEIDSLSRELSRAIGRGGRHRRAGSASERARLSVTGAIKSAIERIAEKHSQLAQHLSSAIRTGTYCCYRPDPRNDTASHF